MFHRPQEQSDASQQPIKKDEEKKYESSETTSTAKKRLIRDCPPLVQHIALCGGLNEDDPADTLITHETMVRGLMELGESKIEAEFTAIKVMTAERLKLFQLSGGFTAEQFLALIHSATQTGIWDKNGNVIEEALAPLYSLSTPANDPNGLIPISTFMKFKQDRLEINKFNNPSNSCARFFAAQASSGEFNSFIKLFPNPTRKMFHKGMEEQCFTLKEILDFYCRPYVSAKPVKERVKELAQQSKQLKTGAV